MRVFGIDVGIQVCGYVICDVKNLDITVIKEGEVKPSPRQSLPQKINCIFEALNSEVEQYTPKVIVVEKLYSHYRHPTTLGVLAQVRGVVALLAHQNKLEFFEYSPTKARKSFMGRGHVKSSQVKRMAENITGKKFKSEHTADAFSLVVAFSHAEKFRKTMEESNL